MLVTIVLAVCLARNIVFSKADICDCPISTELPPYRLPGDVIPRHYDLDIHTNLEESKFYGDVYIELECRVSTKLIKIHVKELTGPDDKVTLTRISDGKIFKISNITLDSENDFLIIAFCNHLEVGCKYSLHIAFEGVFGDNLVGYYKCSYTDRTTGETEWMAVTQFEPIDARRAFPCMDEPAAKATFKIRMAHKETFTAVSNMPSISVQPHECLEGWVWTEFAKSVPMSTYLVALMVSKFAYKESVAEINNVTFKAWARKDAIEQVEFATKYGPKFLTYYEEFFGVKYPLSKHDLVAVPEFDSGAMENWGISTYREIYLLVDEETTSEATRYQVARVVAHELAHQWFGNLVTMCWWTDLWLNEGFATYLASIAIHKEFPEWDAYNYEVVDNHMDVCDLDAKITSHPVSVPINHPDEVAQIFDAISYSKGALILHMMRCFLTEEVFQSGVSNYIRKFSYKNTVQDDLWACLTEAAECKEVLPKGKTVKDVMDTWTRQTGFPVLTMERNGGTITLTQKRFLETKPKDGEEVEGCWCIPVTYHCNKDDDSNVNRKAIWLTCEEKELIIETDLDTIDWIVLNHKYSGVYRVNYDTHTWGLLVELLHSEHFTRLDELNRLTLVSDCMALASVGALDYKTAFSVFDYIRQETAFTPWRAASSAILDLKNLLWRTELWDKYKAFVQYVVSVIYQKFKDFEETPTDFQEVKHQVLILGLALRYEVEDSTYRATQLFHKWMSSTGTNPIPKDLRSIVYCQGVREGGEEEWNFVWEKYQSSNVASETYQFLNALSCTENVTLLNRYLELSLDPSSVKKQDNLYPFVYCVQQSREGYVAGLQFFKKNIQKFHDQLSPNTNQLGSWCLEVLTRYITKAEELEEMKEFVKQYEKLFAKATLSVNQAWEQAENNIQWMNEHYNEISEYLADLSTSCKQ